MNRRVLRYLTYLGAFLLLGCDGTTAPVPVGTAPTTIKGMGEVENDSEEHKTPSRGLAPPAAQGPLANCRQFAYDSTTADIGPAGGLLSLGPQLLIIPAGALDRTVRISMVLPAPKSITPHTVFEATVYILTKDEGGRHTHFTKGYRPQFYFRTTDVTGAVTEIKGAEMVLPGDNTSSVRFGPEGLRFNAGELPTLSLNYAGCRPASGRAPTIIYVDEAFNVREWMATRRSRLLARVSTHVAHFSRYAVAW